MASLNKVQLIGNLCRDPDMRYTPSGAACCRLLVATDESYIDKKTSQRVEEVEFHNVVAWNRTAEAAALYLRKGRQVYIEGKKRTRKWTDDNGKTNYAVEIIAQVAQILGGKGLDTPETAAPWPRDRIADLPPAPTAREPVSETNTTETDPLYKEAIEFVRAENRPTVSALQRHLKIGYNRAARFIDDMEADGIISSINAGGNRTVTATKPESSQP